MVFIAVNDKCTDFSVHFSKEIFDYLRLSHFDKPLNH